MFLGDFSIFDGNTVQTPIAAGSSLVLDGKPLFDGEIIGCCEYSQDRFGVCGLGSMRVYQNRYANHYATAKHVFQYINGTLRLGLVFKTSFNLVGYCHSNWAGHKAHKKLITGYGYKLRNTAITGKSTKQQIVELSSTEPEYMALLWLTQLLKHIGSK